MCMHQSLVYSYSYPISLYRVTEFCMTNYVNVCLSFDENYAQHATVTMMSAVLTTII